MFAIIYIEPSSTTGITARLAPGKNRNRLKNCVWRLGARYGAAYVEDSRIASEVLKIEGISAAPGKAAMATYYSSKGKPYAWQITFSLDRWERVARKLGIQSDETPTRSRPPKKAASGARAGKARKAKAE